MTLFAKTLMIIGFSIFFVGLVAMLAPKLPYIGKLPGDFLIRKGNLTIYTPITSSIIVSLVLTVFVRLISRK